jgi:hypothetical protein
MNKAFTKETEQEEEEVEEASPLPAGTRNYITPAGYARLKALGIEPLTPIQHGVTTSLYYRDPDGNLVELQIDNFSKADEATAYMMGPEFASDSIGPAFDPHLMHQALLAGTPVAELTTRAWALSGPAMPDPMSRFMSPQNQS